MKTTMVVLAALLLAGAASAGEKLEKPRTYGAALTGAPAAALADLLKDPDAYAGKTVTIEGKVANVCENKGCWMIVTDGTNRIRVDFKDYKFFVPYDSPEKRVRVEGVVYRKTVKKETLEHWAAESMFPDMKAEEITGDREMVMFTANGVVMEKGSAIGKKQQQAIGAGEKMHD